MAKFVTMARKWRKYLDRKIAEYIVDKANNVYPPVFTDENMPPTRPITQIADLIEPKNGNTMKPFEDLVRTKEYWLTKIQNQLYAIYHEDSGGMLTIEDMAKRLGISEHKSKQIHDGEFDGTLEELIEIALKLGKVPYLEFINPEEYDEKEELKFCRFLLHQVYHFNYSALDSGSKDRIERFFRNKKGAQP